MSDKDLRYRSVRAGNATFATEIYKILYKTKGNIFFSPLSLHTILSMAAQGSDGEAKRAFLNTLMIPTHDATAKGYKEIMDELNKIDKVTLYLANKIYIKQSHELRDGFKNVITNFFYSEVQPINFSESVSAAQTINAWVENKTNNKIKDLINQGDLDDSTRLLLVNALYFKGKWAKAFEPEATVTQTFYLNENETTEVQMMHRTGNYCFNEIDFLDAKVLAIPYVNRDVNMVIILPNKKNGLAELEEKLHDYDFSRFWDYMYSFEVEVSIPKFKLETTMDLVAPLTELGLGSIFDQNADFSRMLQNEENLCVSKVIQKAFIEVNEEGVEATAANSVELVFCSMPITERFLADRPFVFLLQYSRHSENAITLFKGRVLHPQV